MFQIKQKIRTNYNHLINLDVAWKVCYKCDSKIQWQSFNLYCMELITQSLKKWKKVANLSSKKKENRQNNVLCCILGMVVFSSNGLPITGRYQIVLNYIISKKKHGCPSEDTLARRSKCHLEFMSPSTDINVRPVTFVR